MVDISWSTELSKGHRGDAHGGLWRQQRLQDAALEAGGADTRRRVAVSNPVSHLPPGTSKWNKIEHKLFSFTSMNWRGKALVSLDAIIKMIAATTTSEGLTVRCEFDEKGRKVTD
jgi:hypothetical protein